MSRSAGSVENSYSSFNSAYAVPLSNIAMGRDYMGHKRNTPQDLLDISGIHVTISASREVN